MDLLQLESCRLEFPPSDGSLASLGCIPLYGEGSSDYAYAILYNISDDNTLMFSVTYIFN